MAYTETEETAYWHICKALDVLDEYYRDEIGMDNPEERVEEDINRLVEEAIEDGEETDEENIIDV